MQHTADNQCASTQGMQVMKRLRAFTLVELLIVVVILGILATVVIPMFTDAATNAKSAILKDNLRGIRSALERYKIDHGDYPQLAWIALPYTTDRRGARPGDPDYVSPAIYGPYLRGTWESNGGSEVLVLPLNPFWAYPVPLPGDYSCLAGFNDGQQNPRPMYNCTAIYGYITQYPPSSPGPQDFHAAWGPEGSDCSEGSGDPYCAFDW